ncbi:MAG: ATP-binding protein [Desulfovibrio sp.]
MRLLTDRFLLHVSLPFYILGVLLIFSGGYYKDALPFTENWQNDHTTITDLAQITSRSYIQRPVTDVQLATHLLNLHLFHDHGDMNDWRSVFGELKKILKSNASYREIKLFTPDNIPTMKVSEHSALLGHITDKRLFPGEKEILTQLAKTKDNTVFIGMRTNDEVQSLILAQRISRPRVKSLGTIILRIDMDEFLASINNDLAPAQYSLVAVRTSTPMAMAGVDTLNQTSQKHIIQLTGAEYVKGVQLELVREGNINATTLTPLFIVILIYTLLWIAFTITALKVKDRHYLREMIPASFFPQISPVVGALQDSIFVTDETGKIVFTNKSAKQMLYKHEMTGNEVISDFIISPDGGALNFLNIIPGQELEKRIRIEPVECRISIADNTIIPAELAASSFHIHEQLHHVFAVRDITERREAEEETALNKFRIEALLQLTQMTQGNLHEIADFTLGKMIFLTESDSGCLAFFNKDTNELAHLSYNYQSNNYCNMLDGINDDGVFSPNFWKANRPHFILNSHNAIQKEKLCTLDKENLFRLLAVPIFDQKKLSIVALLTNKSERYTSNDLRQVKLFLQGVQILSRRMQDEETVKEQKKKLETNALELKANYAKQERYLKKLQKTQSKLVQSEKLASLGQLVAGVAHEINTPLGVSLTAATHMNNNVENIKKSYNEDQLEEQNFIDFLDESCELGSIIDLNLKRAAELVQSFKNLTTDQINEDVREIDLKEYLTELIKSLAPKLEATPHSFELECPDNIHIQTLPGSLAQIITNLINNSLLHGFEGIEDGHMSLTIEQSGPSIIMKYHDNGVGMTGEQLKHIYDPFYTTKRGKGGTGLGMHIVYNIITQILHGEIVSQSEIGKGTSTRITFPAMIN